MSMHEAARLATDKDERIDTIMSSKKRKIITLTEFSQCIRLVTTTSWVASMPSCDAADTTSSSSVSSQQGRPQRSIPG